MFRSEALIMLCLTFAELAIVCNIVKKNESFIQLSKIAVKVIKDGANNAFVVQNSSQISPFHQFISCLQALLYTGPVD